MNHSKDCEQVRCPVCASAGGTYFIPVGDFKIFKCPDCGLEHTHPIPSLEQLKRFYSTYTDVRAASSIVRMNAERNLRLLNAFGYEKTKTLLDFGTGDGDFIDVAGENCFGVDFKSADKPRVYSGLTDLPIKHYDFLTLWGVLEHLADPLGTLLELGKYAKPGGVIAITTVDAEGIIPYYYKPVEHLTYWTRDAVEKLFDKIGVELIETRPYRMMQRSTIYVDRLISRTPAEYRDAFHATASMLPEYIEVPTNEIFVVGRYRS